MKWGFTGVEATVEELTQCVGPGWRRIVEDLVADLLKLRWDGIVYQVKEKFAGLRFYIQSGSDAIHERIARAELLSILTCETCGKSGIPRGGGWYKTACDEHGGGTPILQVRHCIYEGGKIVATISIDAGERSGDE